MDNTLTLSRAILVIVPEHAVHRALGKKIEIINFLDKSVCHW